MDLLVSREKKSAHPLEGCNFEKKHEFVSKSWFETGFRCDFTSPLPDLLSEERITLRNGLKTQNFVLHKFEKSELLVHFELQLQKKVQKKLELEIQRITVKSRKNNIKAQNQKI